MSTPDLPSDEVPSEDWAEQQADVSPDSDLVLEPGEITAPLALGEANEVDVVEQETGVPLDDEH